MTVHGDLPKSKKNKERTMADPDGQISADTDDQITDPLDDQVTVTPDDEILADLNVQIADPEDQTSQGVPVDENSLSFLINGTWMSPVATQAENVSTRSKLIFYLGLTDRYSDFLVYLGLLV
jgi:hypothetical protein